MEKLSVTIKEASELTSVSYGQIVEWVETDETFPVFRIGNKRIIEVSLLQEWLRVRCKQRVNMPPTRVMKLIRRKRKVI